MVIRNTVSHAIETQRGAGTGYRGATVALLFSVNGVATLHHSRFAAR